MKIAILADPIDNQQAGVHVYTKRIIEELLKLDKHNEYYFIHLRKNKFFEDTNHFIVPRKKIPGYGTFRKFIVIPHILRKIQPDVVWEPCHIGPFNTPPSAKKVVTIHDLTPILFPEFHIKRSTIIHKLLLKTVLKSADLILTSSKQTKKDIKKLYPSIRSRKKIKTIPLGIDPPKKSSSQPPIKHPYILYLGTIEPRKNLETLIDTFLNLKKTEPKLAKHKLVLAGEMGWKSTKIAIKARLSRHIILTGRLTESQKASYYKHASMFVYPSIYEGFGLPPLEAMSYKTSIITSTGGSLKKLYHRYAIQFFPLDSKKLAKHILSLINSPKKCYKLTDKAYKYSQKFSWHKTATDTLAAIEKIAKQRKN